MSWTTAWRDTSSRSGWSQRETQPLSTTRGEGKCKQGKPAKLTQLFSSEGGSFDITSLPQYKEWESLQNEYLKQEEELAMVESEIDMYKQNNNDLKDR